MWLLASLGATTALGYPLELPLELPVAVPVGLAFGVGRLHLGPGLMAAGGERHLGRHGLLLAPGSQ